MLTQSNLHLILILKVHNTLKSLQLKKVCSTSVLNVFYLNVVTNYLSHTCILFVFRVAKLKIFYRNLKKPYFYKKSLRNNTQIFKNDTIKILKYCKNLILIVEENHWKIPPKKSYQLFIGYQLRQFRSVFQFFIQRKSVHIFFNGACPNDLCHWFHALHVPSPDQH